MKTCSTVLLLLLVTAVAPAQELLKQSSALYPPEVVSRVRANVVEGQWASKVREQVVAAAAPWHAMSDEALWELMFGATLPRAWMVWSNGYSPITNEPVPMYTWKMDAMNHPWKTQDPTSGEWFPKNDFKAYYDSGLDAHGVFDETKADRALLFNTEHPDPADPLHTFGVDDGHGYVNEKGDRWRFIAAYLIYGQWKQVVLGGINNLSAAYVLTGDPSYAHKALVMLDRVADLYPTFDFKPQGIMYEGPGTAGYVSTWHDTCEETRELALAYDMVFPALKDDGEIIAFLAKQAATYQLENPKTTEADIRRNIESRILRDALAHPEKIYSNYPRAEICKAVITKALQEPDEALWAILDPMLEQATAVDGVTGEKGLSGYASFTVSSLAQFLAEFSKADPAFLPAVLKRQPRIHDTYRFHIDTLCLDRYYPLSGDTGSYAMPMGGYLGMQFIKPGAGGWPLMPSTFQFLWDLYAATGDVAFAQTLYHVNNKSLDGLPHDIFGENPEAFQAALGSVIEKEGEEIALGSVNKEAWHLAILRSGTGANRRAVWLDYDAGGGHGHQDGMNLGLFAHGLDLMPEMGYPPVQFGGWQSPRGRWYTMTAAHNTVVVDGKNQPGKAGETTLYVDEPPFQMIRASAPELNDGNRYERTVALVDVDDETFYVIDVFRVSGGTNHTKFTQSHFGPLATYGLNLSPAPDYGHETQTRNFQMDAGAKPGWLGLWTVEDQNKLLPEPAALGLAYTSFTREASAGTSEAWIATGGYDATTEQWVPRLVEQRVAADGTLESTFVAVYEPYAGKGPKVKATREPVADESHENLPENHVGLRIEHPDGGYDMVWLRDPAHPGVSLAKRGVEPVQTDGEVAWLRTSAEGRLIRAGLAQGSYLKSGAFTLENPNKLPYITTATN
ncbi:MAG: heparinase II/III family protein [Candidatus Hydrogenedentes bacterium]|nr:heparinase II/III family protein [Candidatus Hydrogenedentota bacterium]